MAEQTRWLLWTTWRDQQDRDHAERPVYFRTLDAARDAHRDSVIEYRQRHLDRHTVQVHRLAKESKSGDGTWHPTGWDVKCGDVRIRWGDE